MNRAIGGGKPKQSLQNPRDYCNMDKKEVQRKTEQKMREQEKEKTLKEKKKKESNSPESKRKRKRVETRNEFLDFIEKK